MMDDFRKAMIDELLSSPIGDKIKQAMDAISGIQRNLYAMATNPDGAQLNLLKIGTVLQIFLLDTLFTGKRAKDLTAEDWTDLAKKLSQYTSFEDSLEYSAFAFSLYADYIDVSVSYLLGLNSKDAYQISEEKSHAGYSVESIKELSKAIRSNTDKLRKGEIAEPDYIDACLWLSLEAMIKLLASLPVKLIGPECTALLQSISQLGFEYGRYMLYAKENAILDAYIQNQHQLDEDLQRRYDEYLAELEKESKGFQALIDNAFSPNLRNMLMHSAELAHAAGVREEEVLKNLHDVDDFFMG